LLVINPRSGSGRPSPEELAEEADRRGVAARILGPGDDPAEVARAADADVLGVAGGDGSLAAVAEAALERGLPFVCIPYGTRNHFARDLGLDPNDPIEALDAFEGSEQRVDVGRIGNRLFMNNVSLGLYAQLVHERESHRRRRDEFAQLRALLLLARNPRGIRLSVDGRDVDAHVALVAVNAYKLELFSLVERERLDAGRLFLYLAHSWRPREWEERSCERLTIDAGGHQIDAAIDGEPTALETPLDLSIEPGALRVFVPAPG